MAIGTVPEDMLPVAALQKMNKAGGRKKSLVALKKVEEKEEKKKKIKPKPALVQLPG